MNGLPAKIIQFDYKSGIVRRVTPVPRPNKINLAGWEAQNAAACFPAMVEQFANSPKLQQGPVGKYSFKQWYDNFARCFPYAIGDRSLFLTRLSASSRLGNISGNLITKEDTYPNSIKEFLKRESLLPCDDDMTFGTGYHLTALYALVGKDYHWLRIDKNISYENAPYCLSHKWRRRPATFVTYQNGEPVLDPRRICFEVGGQNRVVSNPSREHLSDHYNFVSFVRVPNDLSIDAGAVKKHRKRIRRENPAFADTWDEHLARMQLPRSGPILIPGYDKKRMAA